MPSLPRHGVEDAVGLRPTPEPEFKTWGSRFGVDTTSTVRGPDAFVGLRECRHRASLAAKHGKPQARSPAGHLGTNFSIPPHRSSGHKQFGRECLCTAARIPELCGPCTTLKLPRAQIRRYFRAARSCRQAAPHSKHSVGSSSSSSVASLVISAPPQRAQGMQGLQGVCSIPYCTTEI